MTKREQRAHLVERGWQRITADYFKHPDYPRTGFSLFMAMKRQREREATA